MEKIAIIIKTKNRESIFLYCLESIINYFKKTDLTYKIYIADDGLVSKRKMEKYRMLINAGHEIVIFKNEVSVSFARNTLIDLANDEKYFLRLDDDFEFTTETNIDSMIKIFRADNKIGVVADLERQIGVGKGVFSNQINKWQGFMELNNNNLIKRLIPIEKFKYRYFSDIPYAECDITRNMLLIRKEVLNQIKWDESIYFSGEHEDFLIRVKEAGWKLVFTPASIHNHLDDIKYQEAKAFTIRKEDNLIPFTNKWKIKKISIKRPYIDKLQAGIVKLYRLIGIYKKTFEKIFIK